MRAAAKKAGAAASAGKRMKKGPAKFISKAEKERIQREKGFKAKIKAAEAKQADAEAALENEVKEKQRYIAKLSDMKAKNTALQTEVDNFDNKMESYRENIRTLSEKLDTAQRSEKRWERSCNKAQQGKAEAESKIEELEKIRKDLEERLEKENKRATLAEGRLHTAETSNKQAQLMVVEATERERMRIDEMRKNNAITKQTERKYEELVRDMREQEESYEFKLKAQKSAAHQRVTVLKEKMSSLKVEISNLVGQRALLQEQLAEPRPTLEQLHIEIRSSVEFLNKSLNDRLSEKDAFRGGETMRWKIIRCQVTTMIENVDRIFAALSSTIHSQAVKIKDLEFHLEKALGREETANDRAELRIHDMEMLGRIFQEVPKTQTSVIPRKPEAVVGKPKEVKARLIISETRREAVHSIIEKSRTWSKEYSTILISCCGQCGAFFIDTDISWPCDCIGSLNREHQPYVLHDFRQNSKDSVNNMLKSGAGPSFNV